MSRDAIVSQVESIHCNCNCFHNCQRIKSSVIVHYDTYQSCSQSLSLQSQFRLHCIVFQCYQIQVLLLRHMTRIITNTAVSIPKTFFTLLIICCHGTMQQRLRRMYPISIYREVLGILNSSYPISILPWIVITTTINSQEYLQAPKIETSIKDCHTWWHSFTPRKSFGLLWKFLRPRPWLSTPSKELVGFQCPKIPLYLFNDPWFYSSHVPPVVSWFWNTQNMTA